MLKDRRLLLIFAITFIDVAAAGALSVMVSKYTVGLPNKPIWLTGGTAVMLAIQLAFSPAIGRWSDKAGRRPVTIAMTIASLCTSLLLTLVQTWSFVANRALKGATNGLYAVMRSAVADITEGEELIKSSGIMSFMAGAGTVLGPAVGAVLLLLVPDARVDAMPTVWLIVALSAVNVGLAFLFRETCEETKEKVEFADLAQKAGNSLKIITLWKRLSEANEELPGIKPIFILNMLATLAFGYYSFFVAFLTQSDLNMSPLDSAYFFVYFGVMAIAANLIFFRLIVTHVNKRKVVIGIALINIVLQVGYIFSESSVTLLYVVAGVDAITISLIGGLLGGILTKVTKQGGGQGEMLGSIQGLGGVASFVTALVNSLLSGVSMMAPFIFCALSSVAVVWWSMRLPEEARKYTDRRDDQPQEEGEQGKEQPEEAQPAGA